MADRCPDLEEAWERINVLEDLLADALAHLEGDPDYRNKEAVAAELRAYFDERKARRGDALRLREDDAQP